MNQIEKLREEFKERHQKILDEYQALRILRDKVFDCQTRSHLLLAGGVISIAGHPGRISEDLDLVMKQIELNKSLLRGRGMELDEVIECLPRRKVKRSKKK